MHNTQLNRTDENSSVLGASFERVLTRKEQEIDFEAISIQEEYISGFSKAIFDGGFIGDSDESTEIDSIVNSMLLDANGSLSPFRICRQEDEGEADEILSILKQANGNRASCGNETRGLSRSNPNFYSGKTVSLKGRVLQSEGNLRSLERPSIARPVPVRVSNPFSKNF